MARARAAGAEVALSDRVCARTPITVM